MNSLNSSLKFKLSWLMPWLAVSVLGFLVIANQAIERRRALFETDARIVHRLLSQQVVQHDAILATLALLQPYQLGSEVVEVAALEQRLSALYPHILAIQQRGRGAAWTDPTLLQGEAISLQSRRAVLVNDGGIASGRYRLVLAAEPTSFAMTIDMRSMVPWNDWPMKPESSSVRVVLEHDAQIFALQRGSAVDVDPRRGWRFEFRKRLAADSQPFEVVAYQTMGWHQLPWLMLLLWAMLVGAVLYAIAHFLRQRADRQRAEELLRLGQVARLNTLGELAAGVAHELNQPLTAVLANTQAAQRMLADNPIDLATVQHAMTQATAQALRASEVVGRLRRMVEQPDTSTLSQAVNLGEALRRVVYLLEPESQSRGVVLQIQTNEVVLVQADPVALDQIMQNLLMNALQALEKSNKLPKSLQLTITRQVKFGDLVVADNGLGFAPDVLPRLFEPFFSTREGGLGLGLTLCETLANGMGGQLRASNNSEGGAMFTLSLPLVSTNLGSTPR